MEEKRADSVPGQGTYHTKQIIDCYDHWLVRLYCRIRFVILHQRFLREIGQYLPERGDVLDVGCGFGLFALAFAIQHQGIKIQGFDLNARRIRMAQNASKKLGIENVNFECDDATQHVFERPFDAAYMLDIVHHIPPEAVEPLLTRMYAKLKEDGGQLIIKDVADRPVLKRWFTWWLDKLMDYRTPVHYWSREELTELLVRIGFKVRAHEIVDLLPYPHILYICTK